MNDDTILNFLEKVEEITDLSTLQMIESTVSEQLNKILLKTEDDKSTSVEDCINAALYSGKATKIHMYLPDIPYSLQNFLENKELQRYATYYYGDILQDFKDDLTTNTESMIYKNMLNDLLDDILNGYGGFINDW